MDGKTYRPHDAAQIIGIHANSVRTWCNEFGELLSESAREKPRRLTSSDVAILQTIKQLRDEGFDRPAILHRLAQIPTTELQQPSIDATETPQSATVSQLARQPQPDANNALLALAGSRIDAIDARLGKLERQRSIVVAAVVGAIAGALLLAMGILLAVWLLR